MARKIGELQRVPDEPAMRLLSRAGQQLLSKTGMPANASVAEVLRVLDQHNEVRDMLVLLAVALPARQRTWWACLSARDKLGGEAEAYKTLTSAEAWVYKPTEETYDEVFDALQHAEPMDPASNCGLSVLYSGGKLGPGELADHDAPPGASETSALTMVIDAVSGNTDNPEAYVALVIDRAIDLAQGGSGKLTAG